MISSNYMSDLKNIANFLFEAGNLAKTPRSFHPVLGSGSQSVAEHINRTCYVGYALAKLHGEADSDIVIRMCLFHDFAESRVSDLNYIHQKYVDRHEDQVIAELAKTLSFGSDIETTVGEYQKRESIEAQLAKDADNLEYIVSLKEQMDIGNKRAEEWIPSAVKRLKTDVAQRLVEVILETDSSDWWFGDRNDEWWVSRTKKMDL